MKRGVIIGNGDPPLKSQFKLLKRAGFDFVICADGGADTAFKMKIQPDIILGDLDSISQNTLDYFSGRIPIKEIKRQNDTDIEKSIKTAVRMKIEEAVLLGVIGDRLDHSFCNIGIVLKFAEQINLHIVQRKSILSSYSGTVNLHTIKNETISIYGIDDKTKISSNNLKYKLKNQSLPFGVHESTSNVAMKEEIELKISDGRVLVVRDFETVMKNGLLF